MAERNITVYIQDLDISERGKKTLVRMNVTTLNELEKHTIRDISAVSGVDKDIIQELLNVLKHVDEIFNRFEVRQNRIDEIFEEVKDVSVDKVSLTNRAHNSLRRAGILKVGDMIRMSQRDIISLPTVGDLTNADITSAINSIIAEGKDYFCGPYGSVSSGDNVDDDSSSDERKQIVDAVSIAVGNIAIDDVGFGTRALNSLKVAHINTVGELLRLADRDIVGLKNAGKRTQNEIKTAIEKILSQGSEYFVANITTTSASENEHIAAQSGKGFDFSIIDILSDQFFFKPVQMTEWFGLSRQGIYNVLEKRSSKRREIWTGKKLSDQEREILLVLIQNNKFDYSDNQVTCCCMNNRKDDLACLFIYENEIKCFFLKDLPEDLKQKAVEANYHRYSERELAGETEGKIVSIIKKQLFVPDHPDKFRANASLRGMSLDEYAVFISGYHVGDQRSVTDDQIIAFFDENMVDGKVYISSDPKNQWIRSLASRNGYAIKDFIELYGYESKLDGTELTADGARERHIEATEAILDS